MLSIIVAIDENFAIGRGNQLLCYLPDDLKHFKQITMGHPVVMGRKTFESLPVKPLPNRKNYILSRNGYVFPEVQTLSSLEEVLILGEKEEVFIIGGGELYRQTLPFTKKLYITQIHHAFEKTDVFFPVIESKEWKEIERQEHSQDEKHPYPFTFINYERKEN